MESHFAVPPHWNEDYPKSDDVDPLFVVGTTFKEPECPELWCNLNKSVKWQGPAPDGVVVSVGYDPHDPLTHRTNGAYKLDNKDKHEEL